jgi:hypothetical protein
MKRVKIPYNIFAGIKNIIRDFYSPNGTQKREKIDIMKRVKIPYNIFDDSNIP